VDNKGDELVYLRPGVDFSGYDQFFIVDPNVSFRKDWKSDANSGRRTNKVSDDDMAQMIATGKKLLTEEFTAELTKGGFKVAADPGAKVLAVKPSIYELDIYSPDPDGTGNLGSRTYSDGAGEATLALELYDSVSGQLLAQAFDRKGGGGGDSYSWGVSRSQSTNISDARYAFNYWAGLLVKGLQRTKSAGAAPAAAKK
jgi:hypothetical protein